MSLICYTGIERALGTLFYVQGGFQSNKYFEMYNNRINRYVYTSNNNVTKNSVSNIQIYIIIYHIHIDTI